MRVIHFVEALKGGPATYLEALLPLQRAAYDHVAVLCRQSQAQFVRTPGIELITYPDTCRSLAGIAQLMRYWHRQVTRTRYDIAHLHSSFAGLAGRLGPYRPPYSPRIVYCPHGWAFGMEASGAKKALYRTIERQLARSSDAIVNVSLNEETLAHSAGIPSSRSRLVCNGVVDGTWTPLPRGKRPKNLLFVGRYDRQKGLDTLLAAMPTLAPLGFRLTTIGGPVVGKPQVTRLPPDVRNLGWLSTEDVSEQMAKADVIIMPSRWEGLSLVAIEAMRAGRPIVASAIGGLAELIEEGSTGVLFEPGSPQALAQAVIGIADMDISSMGRKARSRFEARFTATRMFTEIDALYRELGRFDG